MPRPVRTPNPLVLAAQAEAAAAIAQIDNALLVIRAARAQIEAEFPTKENEQ